MNIAIFASAFHPHFGGVEELCRQLARELRRQGHWVIILTNRWPRMLPRYQEIDGIPVYRLAFRGPDAGPKSRLSYALTHGAVVRQTLGVLRKHQVDVLHVQCVSSSAHYALAAQQKLGLPLVVTLQGELTMDASRLFQRSAWAKGLMRESLENAYAITACSRQTLEEAEHWFGEPFGERGHIIYNGISISDAAVEMFAHPKPYILAIGRHVPQKGFDILLRAAKLLVNNPAFQHDLIIAGDGSENENLKRMSSELGLDNRVKFVGRVNHTQAMRLFAGCSFFVLPSRHEPFGIVNLEAMAAGKAIVATNVGGVPEIVEDGLNGLLVAADDVAALAKAVDALAADDILRNRLAASGAKRVKEFTWPTISEEYIGLYREAGKRQAVVV